jgi:hypothetical protein
MTAIALSSIGSNECAVIDGGHVFLSQPAAGSGINPQRRYQA